MITVMIAIQNPFQSDPLRLYSVRNKMEVKLSRIVLDIPSPTDEVNPNTIKVILKVSHVNRPFVKDRNNNDNSRNFT